MDLFGSETVAGKSLGTDLAKGKLTWPVLLAWERAGMADRIRLESLIQHWRQENLPLVKELLMRYQTFEPSREVIFRYLEQARRVLSSLPESSGRSGLLGLTQFLEQQTGGLTVNS